MFEEDTTDPEWIGTLAKQGDWILVSGDMRITKNPQNREAWTRSKLTGFFLGKGWSNRPLEEQAWRLVRWWPDITKVAARVKPGAGFLVHPNRFGKLEQLSLK